MIECKCGGNCGLSFERTLTSRCRMYHPDCPVYAAKREALRRNYHKREYERRLAKSGRDSLSCVCACAEKCGLVFERKASGKGGERLYHPDCPNRFKQLSKRTLSHVKVKHCSVCEGLSWHRAKPRCTGPCGEPWAPEEPLSIDQFMTNKYMPERA